MAYSYAQLQNLIRDAGCPENQVILMAAISMGESSGNPNAINPGVGAGGKPTKEYSVGLWQINTLVHKNYTVEQLKNPQINAKEAVRILKSQGLRAWGAYTDGRYKKYLAGSQAAYGSNNTGNYIDPNNQSSAETSTNTIAFVGGILILVLLLRD